jgi:tetratricopeptide (TPR) repeat protein
METFVRDEPLSRSTSRRPRLWWLAPVVFVALLSGCGSSVKATTEQPAVDPLTAGLKAQNEGRLDEAKLDYQAVLAKDPQNKYAHYNLGLIDQLAGSNDSAETRYRTALKTDPNFTPALFNLAILRTTSAPQEAANLYRQVTKLVPGYAAAHLNLGWLLISMKQDAEGKAELVRAAQLDPSLEANVRAANASPSATPKK